AGRAVVWPGIAGGRGGMESKVRAAELAAAAGIPAVIAAADALGPILRGEERGTRFAAAGTGEPAFKLWLRYGKQVTARIHVDDGARRARAVDWRSQLDVLAS